MEFEIKHYSDIDRDDFHDIISLRIEVFVVEQNCPYQELDGLDKDAYHLILRKDEKIIGTLRIIKPGVVYKEVAIGRVVSSPQFRDKGLGHEMMDAAIKFVNNRFDPPHIRISAQTHLKKFYEDHGFKKTEKEYLEDGIPHCEMYYG